MFFFRLLGYKACVMRWPFSMPKTPEECRSIRGHGLSERSYRVSPILGDTAIGALLPASEMLKPVRDA